MINKLFRKDFARLALMLAFIIALAIQTASIVPVILAAGPFFVDAGKAICSNLVSGLGGMVPKYCAFGTGAGPADSTATALSTEVETRGTGTVSRVTQTVTNDTYQVVGTVTATATRAITECGLFDSGNQPLGVDQCCDQGLAVFNRLSGTDWFPVYGFSFR